MGRGTGVRPRRAARCAVAAAGAFALLAAALSPAHADHAPAEDEPTLHLVTLNGPGTAGHRDDTDPADLVEAMRTDQEQLLAAVGSPVPIYQWTTALNGFAVEIDADQARTLSGNPRVAHVEENAVRPLSTLTSREVESAPTSNSPGRGGAGVVIGFVDSGIDPANRAFSDVAPVGDAPRFRGGCTGAAADPTWRSSDCGAKVVGAQYFVAGFGEDNVRSGDSLSPRDTDGHGTQMASIAAGSKNVVARVGGDRLGKQSGAAPRARIAAYKACWSAPDPAQDGCATADLVAAIDQATADRVDVLNLPIAGPSSIDTIERALLGATEAGVVVVAAAGNEGADAYAAHPTPWVVTVGAATGPIRRGAVHAGGEQFHGSMAGNESVEDAPLVYAADAAAPGSDPAAARACRSGSLDARAVADAVVVCERGYAGRVTKSRAVQRADGVGMVLVNAASGESTNADLHAVPTVHLDAAGGQALAKWAGSRTNPRVTLQPAAVRRGPARIADFSSGGDPRLDLLKPDVVAPGSEILAAVPGGWDLATGTSVSAARVSGIAAVMLARNGGTPRAVRSALVSTARPVDGAAPGLSGAGLARRAPTPSVSYLVSAQHHRAWLEGDRSDLNQPHAVLDRSESQVTRTITNTSDRIIHVAASTEGFSEPVHVFPSWAELAPGDDLTFTVTLPDAQSIQHGSVLWSSDAGDTTRLTVVGTR